MVIAARVHGEAFYLARKFSRLQFHDHAVSHNDEPHELEKDLSLLP